MVKKVLFFGASVVLAFIVTFVPTKIKAADTPATGSVTVVPPRFELFGNPGEDVPNQALKVTNESTVEGSFMVDMEDFKAVGEDGNVNLMEQNSDITYSLAKWITVNPSSFTLKPKETKIINFSVSIPKNAEPGGRYASIIVNMGGQVKVEGGAVVAPRVVSLVLLRVSGNVKEEASVESFTAPQYSEKAPVKFDLRMKNSGRNHIKPKGTIIITNLLGQKVDEIQLSGENVLPGAIRKMTTEWKTNKFLAGRYTATLVATYGEKNDKPLSTTVSFFVMTKSTAYTLGIGTVALALAFVKRKSLRKTLHNLTK
ncbi:MAG: hypothetical protein UT66_C0002G0016 [candidate division CPR2 bacterium GW2011_GWC1_39_9]|uniref:DUF916 domain-containing protein n=1 Tax=candidate division CPR2 bacterium GW2011_GWC2_39_10 TaxID=1618345 RepID=A0A0G0P970_UNCC2|nr:MAG: hypothetical protein UT18_C0009G0075 [candidate division CPR2 bacterium GW2011_GWC2_39_10]KKR36138.1 MAG: hypothetical protein UT66_C0002G0016 [candidate division CPR2 bacterium GW2011_GWC1_39_9]